MNNSSGVGVLDKTISVLSALESGPASLAQLVKATGLARPTAHRIAVALETHRMLARDAQVLLAWEEGGRMHRGLRGAKFSATTLAQVRRRGWAATAAEREPGVASVSAPVRGPGGRILAAVSVSGPIERLTRSPGRMHAAAVVAAGDRISKLLRAET
jgi:DNA-binding IclR family transcriptional regulator